jgi:superfamily II DNA helicase RecQ
LLPHSCLLIELQLIESGGFDFVITGPEILMWDNGPLEKLWKKPDFVRRIQYFVFDESHCLITWCSFRASYSLVSRLRVLIPERIPFYLPTATATKPAIAALKNLLKLRPEHTEEIYRSNDRPNLHIGARFMQHPAYSYRDLQFLFPSPEYNVRRFLVFFNSTGEAEEACLAMRAMLPEHLKNKIAWFHSDMSPEYRQTMIEKLRNGEIWGLFATDAFGMVLCTHVFVPPFTHLSFRESTAVASKLWFSGVSRA